MMTVSSRLARVLPLAFLCVACGYGDDHHDYVPPPDNGPVDQAAIDLNGFIDPGPVGEGTGAFIEYGPEGHWRVFSTCDTKLSGVPCDWRIYLTLPDNTHVTNVQMESLESDDYVYWEGSTRVDFRPYTSTDLDGLQFDVEAGQPLRVEAELDGADAGYLLNWLAGGVVVRGASTNPIDLLPPAPSQPKTQ